MAEEAPETIDFELELPIFMIYENVFAGVNNENFIVIFCILLYESYNKLFTPKKCVLLSY